MLEARSEAQTDRTWSEKEPEERWHRYSYYEIVARDKTSLDIFWLRNKSPSDLVNPPDAF